MSARQKAATSTERAASGTPRCRARSASWRARSSSARRSAARPRSPRAASPQPRSATTSGGASPPPPPPPPPRACARAHARDDVVGGFDGHCRVCWRKPRWYAPKSSGSAEKRANAASPRVVYSASLSMRNCEPSSGARSLDWSCGAAGGAAAAAAGRRRRRWRRRRRRGRGRGRRGGRGLGAARRRPGAAAGAIGAARRRRFAGGGATAGVTSRARATLELRNGSSATAERPTGGLAASHDHVRPRRRRRVAFAIFPDNPDLITLDMMTLPYKLLQLVMAKHGADVLAAEGQVSVSWLRPSSSRLSRWIVGLEHAGVMTVAAAQLLQALTWLNTRMRTGGARCDLGGGFYSEERRSLFVRSVYGAA